MLDIRKMHVKAVIGLLPRLLQLHAQIRFSTVTHANKTILVRGKKGVRMRVLVRKCRLRRLYVCWWEWKWVYSWCVTHKHVWWCPFAPSHDKKTENVRKLPSSLLDETRQCMEKRRRESFFISFLFNVSALAPLWEREDASSRNKFAIIQPDGHSHPQDPALVFGKAPRWINSAESYSNVEGSRALFKLIHFSVRWFVFRRKKQDFF